MFKLQHKITPFLWYESQAGDAAALYLRVFGHGRIVHEQRWGEGSPYPAGSLMAVSLELHGQPLVAFNGGPHFKLTPAASLFVQCDSQVEVDTLWAGLTADGGAPGQCGWMTDRFGLSWQIVPRAFCRSSCKRARCNRSCNTSEPSCEKKRLRRRRPSATASRPSCKAACCRRTASSHCRRSASVRVASPFRRRSKS